MFVIFISLNHLGYGGSVPEKKDPFPRTHSTNAAFDLFFIYFTAALSMYIESVDYVSQSNDMAFHPQQERPRLDVVLDNQYLVLKGPGPDVDPTTLSGHVRLVLTEPTAIKEITLQFKGKAKISSNSYDFLISFLH
jgi:hypothetical protein